MCIRDRYKKGGRNLCTAYPEAGSFSVMVVIPAGQMAEADLLVASCSAYTQKLYQDTEPFQGSQWLMLRVDTPEILADLLKLIACRARAGKKRAGAG